MNAMATELKIPSVGESITEVQIGEWLKAEGDTVKQDEPVAVLESEKSSLELSAPHNGRLVKILHQAGETVAVGTVVAQFEADGQGSAPPAQPAAQTETTPRETEEKPAPTEEKTEAVEVKPAVKPQEPDDRGGEHAPSRVPDRALAVGPGARPPASNPSAEPPEPKLAPEPPNGPSESKLPEAKPSSPAKPASGHAEEVVPMTMLRRTVARRLVEAQQTMAMLTTFNEADLSGVQALRKEYQPAFEKRHGVKLGLMSFFVKAAIDALKQFPQLNAEIRGDNIIYRDYFDIGVAVSTERGLVVPVLRHAERLSFAEVEKAISDFARRAKDGQLKPDELEGGTFTITNGGVFGSLLSTPIINPPQSGILGLHAVQERPVAVLGQVVVRPMMYLALTYDHRLVDGREAVLWLRRIKEDIETPARMLIEV